MKVRRTKFGAPFRELRLALLNLGQGLRPERATEAVVTSRLPTGEDFGWLLWLLWSSREDRTRGRPRCQGVIRATHTVLQTDLLNAVGLGCRVRGVWQCLSQTDRSETGVLS